MKITQQQLENIGILARPLINWLIGREATNVRIVLECDECLSQEEVAVLYRVENKEPKK